MKRTNPFSKLCKLTFVLALLLAPMLRQADAASQCPTGGCGYTWDPVERCCVAAWWSDCPDRCF